VEWSRLWWSKKNQRNDLWNL